jgi:outer membrane lipopolysaccharide assembly protein LptE/RlpB
VNQVASSKWQVASKYTWQGLFLLLAACHLLLISCGFHLRGTGKVEMPPALSVMQVRVEGNLLENHPLLVAVKNALHPDGCSNPGIG